MIVTLLFLSLFINIALGLFNYEFKSYKVSCFNFFSAGYCSAVLLYIILKPI